MWYDDNPPTRDDVISAVKSGYELGLCSMIRSTVHNDGNLLLLLRRIMFAQDGISQAIERVNENQRLRNTPKELW